ncbi:MAG: hypothetical protein ACRDTN_21675, partial [Mycobacterium sp.]
LAVVGEGVCVLRSPSRTPGSRTLVCAPAVLGRPAHLFGKIVVSRLSDLRDLEGFVEQVTAFLQGSSAFRD